MRALSLAIDGLELPAVEKISEAQAEDPFQVLIATALSARTQDPTTLAASTPRANLVRNTSRLRARPLSGFLSSCAARSANRSSAVCHRASTAVLIRPPPRRPAPSARQPVPLAHDASLVPSRSGQPCPRCW